MSKQSTEQAVAAQIQETADQMCKTLAATSKVDMKRFHENVENKISTKRLRLLSTKNSALGVEDK